MKLVRKRLITEEEANVILDALKEKHELVFPLSAQEVTTVIKTNTNAQSKTPAYTPSLTEKASAKWNYNYASVATFALWLGPRSVLVEPSSASDGRPGLRVSLIENNNIN